MNGKIKLFTKKNKGILILAQGKKRQDEKINRISLICSFPAGPENSAVRNHLRTDCGIIPFIGITPVHYAEFFRLSKVCADSERNFSASRKQANSPCGIIPFAESACGQRAE